MTTALDTRITRETCIRYQNRTVTATLSPATPCDTEKCIPAMPERIEFRLKGTQQVVWLPLSSVFLKARGAFDTTAAEKIPTTQERMKKE